MFSAVLIFLFRRAMNKIIFYGVLLSWIMFLFFYIRIKKYFEEFKKKLSENEKKKKKNFLLQSSKIEIKKDDERLLASY